MPYALDEPTLPPYITLSVPGGSSAVYSMNSNAEGDVLCYENFFYIAFTGTMKEYVLLSTAACGLKVGVKNSIKA